MKKDSKLKAKSSAKSPADKRAPKSAVKSTKAKTTAVKTKALATKVKVVKTKTTGAKPAVKSAAKAKKPVAEIKEPGAKAGKRKDKVREEARDASGFRINEPVLDPIRPEDSPGAMLQPQSQDVEGPYSGPYTAGGVWAVLDGSGTVLVDGAAPTPGPRTRGSATDLRPPGGPCPLTNRAGSRTSPWVSRRRNITAEDAPARTYTLLRSSRSI